MYQYDYCFVNLELYFSSIYNCDHISASSRSFKDYNRSVGITGSERNHYDPENSNAIHPEGSKRDIKEKIRTYMPTEVRIVLTPKWP